MNCVNEKDVLQFLENKYNEKFEIINSISKCFGISGDRWGAKPIKGTHQHTFTVVGSKADEEYKLGDSYYSVLIQREYENFVYGVVYEHIKKFKLTVDINKEGANPQSLVAGVGVYDIHRHIENNEYIFNSKIIIETEGDEDETDRAVHKICQKLSEIKLLCWVKCIVNGNKNIVYYVDYNYNINKLSPTSIKSAELINQKPRTLLSNWQIESLCSIVYLNSIINNEDLGYLGDIMQYIKVFGFADSKINGKYPCKMTELEWAQVISDIIDEEDLSELKIIKSVDVTEMNATAEDAFPGHRAICFMDNVGNAYAIFRGTSGDFEWSDNACGMVYADTKQQLAAAKFINEIRENDRGFVRHLTVAGHSKGGNKAQYCAITTSEGYVNRCVSIDGQGFSTAFMNKYAENIDKRKNIVDLLAEQRDFVNGMGFCIDKTIYYRGWRGESTWEQPYGQPLPYFHCPDALKEKDGEYGRPYYISYISKTINTFVEYFLTNPKYEEERLSTAEDLMMLFMASKYRNEQEILEGFKNIIIVFLELLACKETFKDDIINVLNNETDVIIATVESARVKNRNDFGGKLLSLLVKEIVSDAHILNNFLDILGFLLKTINKMMQETGTDYKMLNFIFEWVENILKLIVQKSKLDVVTQFLKRWHDLRQNAADRNNKITSQGLNSSDNQQVFNDLEEILWCWKQSGLWV